MDSFKKIIIIARSIYPSDFPRSYRATELAIELARKGNNVTLYAVLGNYDYSNFEKEYGLKVKNIGHMLFSTLDSDGKIRNNIFDKILWKLFNRILEFPDIELMFHMPKLLKREKNTDVLITIAMPHPIHWGCAFTRKLFKKKFPTIWISDCGDPYIGNKSIKNKPFFYFKILENFFLNQSDFITIPVKEAISCYNKKFHHKFRIIPQGFRIENHDNNLVILNNIPTFAYAGSFYKGIRDPIFFINYLLSLDCDFKFIIYTNDVSLIDPLIFKIKHKIEIRKQIPRNELLQILSQMDFLVNFENNSQTQSPSKLIDYTITGRPILSISERNFNINIFLEFLNRNYTNQLPKIKIDEYDIKNVVLKFETLFS
jgi:hypothetical protein